MQTRKIKLNPHAIEKMPLYRTLVEFDGNRLEFFTEWQKRFVNTEIVVLDMIETGRWTVMWFNKVYDQLEPASPVELNLELGDN